MQQLDGKVVLLTGGSRGIGPVLAQALACRGAHLVLTARSEDGLDKTAQRLAKQGFMAHVLPADLSKPAERNGLVAQAREEFGRIDILINNAGLETEGAYTDLSWQAIRETIEVNMIAPMELTHMVLPEMIRRGSGHIVNIASIAAKSGAPYAAVYSGTKAGMAEWTRSLRLELAGTGIGFSTIFPGYVRDVGMFARFGMKSPWVIGSCSPTQVAGAVVKAIEKNRIEIIVNSLPLRYSFVLNEVSPTIGDWLMHVSGLVEFQQKKVGEDLNREDR